MVKAGCWLCLGFCVWDATWWWVSGLTAGWLSIWCCAGYCVFRFFGCFLSGAGCFVLDGGFGFVMVLFWFGGRDFCWIDVCAVLILVGVWLC